MGLSSWEDWPPCHRSISCNPMNTWLMPPPTQHLEESMQTMHASKQTRSTLLSHLDLTTDEALRKKLEIQANTKEILASQKEITFHFKILTIGNHRLDKTKLELEDPKKQNQKYKGRKDKPSLRFLSRGGDGLLHEYGHSSNPLECHGRQKDG